MGRQTWTAAVVIGMGALGLMAGEAGAEFLDDLVFAYDMEDITGNTVADISGNGNDGTKGSDFALGTTDPLAFSSQHLTAPANTASSDVGIASGVTLGSSITGMSFSIFIDDNDNTHSRYRLLSTMEGGYSLTVGKMLFDVDAGAGGKQMRLFAEGVRLDSPVGIDSSTGAWRQLGFTFDGGTVRFYANGSEVANGTLGAVTSIGAQDDQFFVGAFENGPAGEYLPGGDYDEVGLWYRALSAQEMNDVYTQGLAALIPEPTSLALLSACGLLTLTRRRRS